MNLQAVIDEHIRHGATVAKLGVVKHPDGYRVLRNFDGTHYYWVCEDGRRSVICWDRWAVARAAKKDSEERKRKGVA